LYRESEVAFWSGKVFHGQVRTQAFKSGLRVYFFPCSCPCVCSNLPAHLYIVTNSSSSIPFRYKQHLLQYPKRPRPTAWQLPIAQPGHCRSTFTSQCASTPRPAGPSTSLLTAFSQPSLPFAKPGGNSRGVLSSHIGCIMPSTQARKKGYFFE